MYDILKAQCPDLYNLKSDMNIHNSNHATLSQTKRLDDLCLPTYNTAILKTPFLSHTPDLLNCFDNNLKNAYSRKSFKIHLKEKLLDGYLEKVEYCNSRCTDQRFHIETS